MRIAMNRLRARREQTLGLGKTRRVYHRWFLCSSAVALFPAWLASAPDWPRQLQLTGFPLFDESAYVADPQRSLAQLPQPLRQFVTVGKVARQPIVAVTLGSAPPPQAAGVFAAAVAATAALGARCIILTGAPGGPFAPIICATCV